jgi:peptidyl-prolyl cis-trans isomerase SurA
MRLTGFTLVLRSSCITVAALVLALAAGSALAQGQGFGMPRSAAPQSPFGTTQPTPPTQPAPPQGASRKPPRAQTMDRIVAVVNSDVITQRDLALRIAQVEMQLRQGRVPAPPADVLQRQVLERMITERAQLQFARDTGVRIDDVTLDRTIERIAEQNKMTLTEFRAVLEKDGLSFDRFREDIRNEITLQRLREREVEQKIQVSESEIDNFIEDQKNVPASTGGEYNLAHILVRIPENASPEQVEQRRQRAEAALKQAQSGMDFREVAVAYSEAPDALQGGALGWRPQDRLPELFATAVAKMKPGEISGVLRSPAGFHILRLSETRGGAAGGGGAATVEQTRARHILVRIGEKTSEGDAERKIALLRQRIVQGEAFAEVARLNSDDASASRGGDLGWILPNDTVPEFERAMSALKIGELSQPVRSPFGFHIIEVTERRNADVSSDRKRAEARRVLRDRRADEAYEEWLRQLRDRAYVEYRTEER